MPEVPNSCGDLTGELGIAAPDQQDHGLVEISLDDLESRQRYNAVPTAPVPLMSCC